MGSNHTTSHPKTKLITPVGLSEYFPFGRDGTVLFQVL